MTPRATEESILAAMGRATLVNIKTTIKVPQCSYCQII